MNELLWPAAYPHLFVAPTTTTLPPAADEKPSHKNMNCALIWALDSLSFEDRSRKNASISSMNTIVGWNKTPPRNAQGKHNQTHQG